MEYLNDKKDSLFKQITEVICKGEDVSMDVLLTPIRHQEVVFARQLVLYFAREMKLGSLTYIGNKLNRDHATVMHSIKTISDYIDTDKGKADKIAFYRKKLGCVQSVSTKLESLQGEIIKIKFELSEIQNKAINVQVVLNGIEEEISAMKLT